ncbi:MAG: hypothetical protein CMH63_00870 [Nanoarchaeota archaeon]|jgi:8-oxo-dGTP diphosphatase|nr:hypothetical protein [Nanoarchaeota archaeon]
MDKHIVVVTGLVKYQDKFLIVKRNPDMEMHPDKWIFPGGKVTPGEDLFQALKREIKEETNLEIEDKKEFISDFTFTRLSGIQTIGFCFLVKAKHNKISLNQEELSEHTWISPKEVEKYNIVEFLKAEIKKASENHKSF